MCGTGTTMWFHRGGNWHRLRLRGRSWSIIVDQVADSQGGAGGPGPRPKSGGSQSYIRGDSLVICRV